MRWNKLNSIEYQELLTNIGNPNGLYYKGIPILFIYENSSFFNIMSFLQLIEYYYAYPGEGEIDMKNFKDHIYNKIKIEELLEYVYSPNGEERAEIKNTCNKIRFPFIWTYEDELRVYIPRSSQKWKIINYVHKNPYYYILFLQNIQKIGPIIFTEN